MLSTVYVTIAGNVSREVTTKISTVTGRRFAVIPVAVNNRRFDRESEQFVDEGTSWWDVTAFGSLGANAVASLKPGTPVVVSGKMSVQEWEHEGKKGQRLRLRAESLGIDLTFGAATYSKGKRAWPVESEEGRPDAPPTSEGGVDLNSALQVHRASVDGVEVPVDGMRPSGAGSDLADLDGLGELDEDLAGLEVDSDGVVSDQAAEELLERSA